MLAIMKQTLNAAYPRHFIDKVASVLLR